MYSINWRKLKSVSNLCYPYFLLNWISQSLVNPDNQGSTVLLIKLGVYSGILSNIFDWYNETRSFHDRPTVDISKRSSSHSILIFQWPASESKCRTSLFSLILNVLNLLNWIILWNAGFLMYFGYGIRNSKLNDCLSSYSVLLSPTEKERTDWGTISSKKTKSDLSHLYDDDTEPIIDSDDWGRNILRSFERNCYIIIFNVKNWLFSIVH